MHALFSIPNLDKVTAVIDRFITGKVAIWQ